MNRSNLHREQRRSKRVGLETNLRYQIAREIGGHATVVNVDQGGMAVKLPTPLKPGQLVMLEVSEPKHGRGSVELKGRVAWCRLEGTTYLAGIHVYQDEFDARIALTALMCAALKKQAAVADVRNRHFIQMEWKLAALAASEEVESHWIWKKREPVKRAVGRILALGY